MLRSFQMQIGSRAEWKLLWGVRRSPTLMTSFCISSYSYMSRFSQWISRFLEIQSAIIHPTLLFTFHNSQITSQGGFKLPKICFLNVTTTGWLRYSCILIRKSWKYVHKFEKAVIYWKDLLYWIAEKNCPKDIWLPDRNILDTFSQPFLTFFANIFVWNYFSKQSLNINLSSSKTLTKVIWRNFVNLQLTKILYFALFSKFWVRTILCVLLPPLQFQTKLKPKSLIQLN